MAGIDVINSQGTILYVVDVPSSAWADCTAALSAIASGKVVGCPQTIGNITETRSVTEYKCISSNETAKALGSISRGSMEIGLLLNPADSAGQAELALAFKNNTEVIIAVELPDIDTSAGTSTTSGSGTTYWFSAKVSETNIGIEQDSAVTYSVTVEISSDVTECAMVPST